MGWKFNPFTGALDQTGSKPDSYVDGEVATYNDLPLDGTAALNTAWLVREASGSWLTGRKPAGIYIRTATAGVSRDADYTYAGIFPDVFSDANFTLYDNGDSTKTAQFQLSGITAGQNRVLTVPDASGTIARTEDFAAPPAIGGTTPNSGAFTTLSANNGTLTASAPVLDLEQTWNNAAVTFTGLKFNVTNTASASGSKVLDIQAGGQSVLETNRIGMTVVRRLGSAVYTNAFEIRNDNTLLFNVRDDGVSVFANSLFVGGTNIQLGGGVKLRSDFAVNWSSTGSTNDASDLFLYRDAADTLAQRRSTNAQTFRIYNTYTDASNYERAKIAWSSNVLQIGTEKAGTGSARALEFYTDGTSRLTISTAGVFQFGGTTSSFPALKRSSTTLQVRLADDSAYSVLDAQLRAQGTAPATSGATGTAGDIRYDADYIYVCTAANTWKRAAIATW